MLLIELAEELNTVEPLCEGLSDGTASMIVGDVQHLKDYLLVERVLPVQLQGRQQPGES